MSALTNVLDKLDGVKQRGDQYAARCPASTHGGEDRNPSLGVKEADDGRVLLLCRAGCPFDAIIDGLGLTPRDLAPETPQEHTPGRGEWTPFGEAVAIYDYRDEEGNLLFQVLRTADKQFPQRKPDPTTKSGYAWKLGGTRRVPYHLPQLIAAVSEGKTIGICEGEKDVHNLERAGMAATCNPGGAGKWLPTFAQFFEGATVVICADKDKPGQAHARQVAEALTGIAARITVVEAADPHKDVSDHLAAGLALSEMVRIGGDEEPVAVPLAEGINDFLDGEDEPYDWLVPNLIERRDRLILTGSEGLGKALALDTPVPTTKGWKTQGELSVGDEVFSADGSPVRIVATTDVMYDRHCYRVRFSDGAEIVADEQHQWLTETLAAREAGVAARRRGPLKPRGTDQSHLRRHFPAVVTTADIASTLMARNGHAVNHSVRTCQPLQYPAQEVSIPPYVLGAWLGDGTSAQASLTCHEDDIEIIERTVAEGQPCRRLSGIPYRWALTSGRGGPHANKLQVKLRALGVLGNKHIPESYLHASVDQRLALLQGLMDTDGTVSADGMCEFSVCSERLASDVHELLHGLGIKSKWKSGPAKIDGREVGTRYRLHFQTELPVFYLKRKAERIAPLRTQRAKLRYIVAVEPVESVPVRCIQVERADGLYVVGRECITTHNSTLNRQLAICLAAGLHPFTFEHTDPCRVLLIDCENTRMQNRRRYRPLRDHARKVGRPVDNDNLRIILRNDGLDLTKRDDTAWLHERVRAHKPDVLFIGPIYKLHYADPNAELPARSLIAAIDGARDIAGCAVIMEAHSGHGVHGDRSVRPIGASIYLRWPEFGYGLSPTPDTKRGTPVEFKAWRGPRDERDWPEYLRHGGDGNWPWVQHYNEQDYV